MGSALFLSGCAVVPQSINGDAARVMGMETREALRSGQESYGEIDLPRAIALAVQQNRDYRLNLMESTLAIADLEVSNLDMLPDLTARAGYRMRSEPVESFSESDGQISNQPSISQEKNQTNAELSFGWSVLDFGLSYVRAQQAADRFLIARERERKAIQNIVLDVRNAYWRAVGAERLLSKVEPLTARVTQALEQARTVERSEVEDPLQPLEYQRQLGNIRRSLLELRSDLVGARIELARLMGLTPGTEFRLVDVNVDSMPIPEVRIDLATMEKVALAKRPELMESRYEMRISRREVRASLLSMFPNLTLGAGLNYDSNKFLNYNNWSEYSAGVSWNLMQIFRGPAGVKAAEVGEALAAERQLALSMGILTQLHISMADFEQAIERFDSTSLNLDVAGRILKEVESRYSADRVSGVTVVQEQLNTLVAELRRDLAYADIQDAWGRIMFALGVDPLDQGFSEKNLDELAGDLDAQLDRWESGELTLMTRPLGEQELNLSGAGLLTTRLAEDSFDLMSGELSYSAVLADGRPLPDWLTLSPQTAIFTGNPPADIQTLDLRVIARNQSGTSASDDIRLTFAATNDAPMWQTDDTAASITVEEGDGPATTPLQTLELMHGDVDETIRLAVELVDAPATDWVESLPLEGMLRLGQDQLSGIGPHAVEWNFDSAPHSFDRLPVDESLRFEYRIMATDAFGAEAVQPVSVTVRGTGDRPVVALAEEGDAALTLTESGEPLSGFGGVIVVDGLERRETVTAESRLTAPAAAADQYAGMLNLDVDKDAGLVNWGFDSGNMTFDSLAAGQRLTLGYRISVTDGQADPIGVPVLVHIDGSNSAPDFVVDADSGLRHEANLTRVGGVASGSVAVSDIDAMDVARANARLEGVDYFTDDGEGFNPQNPAAAIQAARDALTVSSPAIDAGHTEGELDWQFFMPTSSLRFVTEGRILELRYILEVTDGDAFARQPLTIVIRGLGQSAE